SGLNLRDTIPVSAPCSLALLSFRTSISTSRRLDRTPGSSCKPRRLRRRPPVRPRAQLVWTNDGRGAFTLAIIRGGEPVAGSRRGGGADFHGGARYDYRGGGAALHRRRPVGHGR